MKITENVRNRMASIRGCYVSAFKWLNIISNYLEGGERYYSRKTGFELLFYFVQGLHTTVSW